MITNGMGLLHSAPIEDMIDHKAREHGVSYGLTEAGYDIRIKQEMLLSESNRFALASTIERFQMPKTLAAVVHDKSTWARRGLSVFNTVIEPGWFGWLTLELVYHGQGEIHIPAGVGIAQVLFHHLEEPADYGDGKYQNQKDEPVGPITA
jgi:dCTP deaminase